MNARNLFFVLLVVATAGQLRSFACSCLAQTSLKDEVAGAVFVFRGTATELKEFPRRAEMGDRRRYAVVFRVSRYWKGTSDPYITLHLIEPGTDCLGARFDVGREYLIFAVARRAEDHNLGDNFWYGWLDILPKGLYVATVNNFCDSTAEISKAKRTVAALGKGRVPRGPN